MMSSPTAYHEPDAILAALGTRPEKMRSVAHFFDNHMEGAGSVDFTSSLIILPETDGWRFGAHLCLAPNIEQLPMIFRTGDGSPQMDGRPLHLTTNQITDPHLQRMGSLHFCRTALAEDLAGLVAKLRVRVAQAVKAKPDWKIDTNNDTSIIRNMLHDMEIRYDKTNVREVVRSLERLLLCADDSFKHEFQRFISEYCGGLTASDVEKLASPADSSEFLLYDLLAAAISSVLLRKWRHFFNDELIACEKNSVNLVIQGAGDLSMNSWNVAFYRDKNRLPRMVAPESGPNFRGRKYHCLVAWKAGRPIAEIANYVKKYQLGTTLGRSLSIARLQFPAGSTSLQFEDRDGSRAEEPASLHESVEFALYGKPVLWNGEVIKPEKFVADEALVEQFQDLRHVFNLPNLNNDPSFGPHGDCGRDCQDKQLQGKQITKDIIEGHPENLGEYEKYLKDNFSEIESYLGKPRVLLGNRQSDEIWLLERELLKTENTSLRRLACGAPIVSKLADLGAAREWIHCCLLKSGYVFHPQVEDVTEAGDFAWDRSSGSDKLHIYLRPNTYPCTMIGIGRFPPENDRRSSEPNALYLLAWGHDFSYAAHTIWDCAEVIRAAGAQYALCIDEGRDVFQCFVPGSPERSVAKFLDDESLGVDLRRWMKVPISFDNATRKLNRFGMRASIAIWQEQIA